MPSFSIEKLVTNIKLMIITLYSILVIYNNRTISITCMVFT